eukprot:g16200.t1
MRRAAELKDDVSLHYATSYTLWDADKIWGCICDPGYSGYDCSLRTCPYGDDTKTSGVNEVQTITCECDSTCSGTFKLTFRGETTDAIAPTATTSELVAAIQALRAVRNVTITYNSGSTVCGATAVVASVTFTHNAGNLPSMIATSSLATTGTTASVSVGTTTEGTRDWQECSHRGICDTGTGICDCEPGWTSSNGGMGSDLVLGERGDCSMIISNLASNANACPQDAQQIECGGRGVCSNASEYLCNCNTGYTGADCSLRACPTGVPWFQEAVSANTARGTLEECSGRGICDRTSGTCTCQNGFTGTSCAQLECVKGTGDNYCNNKGTCKTIAQLAALSSSEGVALGYTYGTNGLAATWDHDKIMGCHCSTNLYFGPLGGDYSDALGYDCGSRLCPHGDDPLTPGTQQEVQAIVCTGTGGTFTLTFRGETTGAISYNAVRSVAAESGSSAGTGAGESLEAKLEALSTVKSLYTIGVDITYSSGSSLCTSDGSNTVSVTFRQALGDLPLMTAASSLTGGSAGVSIYEEKKSNQENIECSGRGICDRGTGTCRCHFGFTSSDGNGASGSRGDCGYYTEHQDLEGYPTRI